MFEKTEEQRIAVYGLRRFLDDKLEPEILSHGEEHFSRSTLLRWLESLSEFGLIKAPFPEAIGGLNSDWMTHILLFEEVAYSSIDVALPILINVTTADMLCRLGSAQLIERYVPPLLAGKSIASFAISEPDTGSDVASVHTRAVRDGDHWIINGEKTWISNGGHSDFLLCTCLTEEGLTHILIDREEHGYETREIKKIALNGQSTAQIFLTDARVPVVNTIGIEGRALQQTLVAFERARCHMGIWGVALGRRALHEAVGYARERTQHGRKIAGHQLIAEKIATMATEVDAARLLAHRAVAMIDSDIRCDKECAMAKWYGTEIAIKATRDAVQIHGGNGVTKEFIVERLAREAIVGTIPDGTTEIQKLLIARSLTGVQAFR